MNIKQLAARLLGAPIAESDVEEIIRRLPLDEGGPDYYHLLSALGKTGDARHREIFENALNKTLDPMIAELSLKALVRWMANKSDYRAYINRFLRSANFEFRLAGAELAPDCLEIFPDDDIVALLQRITQHDDSEVVKDAASDALDRYNQLILRAKHIH